MGQANIKAKKSVSSSIFRPREDTIFPSAKTNSNTTGSIHSASEYVALHLNENNAELPKSNVIIMPIPGTDTETKYLVLSNYFYRQSTRSFLAVFSTAGECLQNYDDYNSLYITSILPLKNNSVVVCVNDNSYFALQLDTHHSTPLANTTYFNPTKPLIFNCNNSIYVAKKGLLSKYSALSPFANISHHPIKNADVLRSLKLNSHTLGEIKRGGNVNPTSYCVKIMDFSKYNKSKVLTIENLILYSTEMAYVDSKLYFLTCKYMNSDELKANLVVHNFNANKQSELTALTLPALIGESSYQLTSVKMSVMEDGTVIVMGLTNKYDFFCFRCKDDECVDISYEMSKHFNHYKNSLYKNFNYKLQRKPQACDDYTLRLEAFGVLEKLSIQPNGNMFFPSLDGTQFNILNINNLPSFLEKERKKRFDNSNDARKNFIDVDVIAYEPSRLKR